MISSVTSSSYTPPPPPRGLNDEQGTVVSDTLSQFDPQNLSTEDAQSIVAAFQDAGIKPGKALASAMEEAGFDAKQVGELAGVEKPKGPPPRPLSEEQNSVIESVLSDFDAGDITEGDARTIVTAFQDAGIRPGKELAEAMASFGFDAMEIGNLAGNGNRNDSSAVGNYVNTSA